MARCSTALIGAVDPLLRSSPVPNQVQPVVTVQATRIVRTCALHCVGGYSIRLASHWYIIFLLLVTTGRLVQKGLSLLSIDAPLHLRIPQ